ncbi:MAG TPA: hypothetical protein VFN35_21955 [Ktedonobacteraceae bacterium]|nr:hypothetical protein [Ktedonobacteraceae bacterium]
MRKYCKAYHLKDLRQFSAWTEKRSEQEQELSDDDVVYLWDDFTVVRSPVIPDKGLIFDEITPEWQSFCKQVLAFEIPEDLRYAYEQPEQSNNPSEDILDTQDKVSV